MPGAGRTHGPPATRKAGGSHHRYAERPGIPCAMVYGLYVLSPVSGLVSHRRPEIITPGLIPASGDQDRATSPYA